MCLNIPKILRERSVTKPRRWLVAKPNLGKLALPLTLQLMEVFSSANNFVLKLNQGEPIIPHETRYDLVSKTIDESGNGQPSTS